MRTFMPFAIVACISLTILPASAGMNGPDTFGQKAVRPTSRPMSTVAIAFDWAILGFQKVVSPADGPRCGFYPTCSGFARQAIGRLGPLRGVMMTGDRLIRCNHWKQADDRYVRLQNGRLYDPVHKNSLQE